MKKKTLLTLFTCLLFIFSIALERRTLFGKITDGKNAMENVNIKIIDKETATISDEDGSYEITIDTGDLVQFSYAGMKTITIRMEAVTRVLNPVMVPVVTELEEVVVKGSNRKTQSDLRNEYGINKSIVKTAFGYLNTQTAPGMIRVLEEKDINMVNTNILGVLQNRLPGVTVKGEIFGSRPTNGDPNGAPAASAAVFIRGRNSLQNNRAAVFDVDGQIFTDVPTFIDLGNIKRVAVLSNVALTSRYGNVGHGGVIVINTITGSAGDGKFIDQAKLRNNFYDGKALTQEQVQKNWPSYLTEMHAANSFEEAKKVYDSYTTVYHSSPYFYLDAYNYFSNTWNENEFSDGIINENFGLFENNAVLLKALAYSLDEQNRFERSNDMYKEAFILRPNYVQSYLDMANSYRDLNEPKQAASIYARYEYLLTEGFLQLDTIGFDPIITREFNNLLSLNKNAVVKGEKGSKLYVAEEGFKGTRLVFEWNDSEAEFDLQFVNPENQYLKWQHTLADNEATILREKEFGYNVKEYLIDGSLPGTWQVNINYFGNKSLTPTYLKATVYSNYGTKAQRKDVKVFKVDLKNVNQELFRVNVAGGLTQE